MAEQILDGGGSGTRATVGADNRLQVRAISETEIVHNAELGNAFNFNTGLISITADATLMYLKNNADNNLIIETLVVAGYDGLTHTDFPDLTIVRNPTGGDLITDETAIDANQNRNFGSSKIANVNVYKGKVGGTLTGGDDLGLLQASKTGRSTYPLNLLLPKGASIGVTLNVSVSSGTANWYCALIGYFKDEIDAE